MTRNKSVEVGSYSKSKPVKQEKKEKLSVSALFASMDQNHEKTKKPPMIKSKATPKVVSYTDGIDLPPSDDEDEDEEEGGYSSQKNHRQKEAVLLETRMTDKELKKREKKEMISANASEIAKLEALKDDHDAVTITIGKRASLLDGGDCVGANVKDISIEDISVSVRGIKLLSNVSVKISNGKKYGLVGPNGAGKSTLLKLLARRKIPVPKNIDLLFVEQEVVGDDRTTIEAVVSASTELMKLREEAAALQISSENEDVGEKLAEVYEKLQLLDSDKAEARASKILAGLGFTKEMQGRCTKSFSGGWRMRISLAQALFIQPTLLLLDEPTNHLDLKAVLWLEEYLCHWRKTLVVVSHDQDFLTTVCSDIIHVDDLQLYTYHGGFSGYQTGNAQLRKERLKKDEIREKQIKAAQRSGNQAQQKKVKEQAAAKESLRKRREYSVEFHFPVPTELASSSLLQLIEVSFEYPSRPDFRLADVDVGIDMATRVAIVGPNGAGKSTLLKLLAGDLTPTKGEARRSQKLRIGRYSQHFVDLLRMEDNPVQYLLRLHPDQQGPSRQEAVRAKLGKFGLPKENHLMPIAKLSGGQKARVVLTSICMLRPHILLLDEPTNHLDMESIDALADALDEFVGGVVLVSHNSRLISRVCQDEEKSQIWVVEDGTVKRYPGQFDDYKEELQMGIKEELGIAIKI